MSVARDRIEPSHFCSGPSVGHCSRALAAGPFCFANAATPAIDREKNRFFPFDIAARRQGQAGAARLCPAVRRSNPGASRLRISVLRFCARVCLMTALLWPAARATAQEVAPSASPASAARASDFIPASAIAAVTVEKGAARLDEFRKGPLMQKIEGSDFYRALQANPGFNQAKIGMMGVSGATGVDAWELFGTLLGENVTLAIEPFDGGKPTLWIVCVTDRPETARKLSETVNQFLGLVKEGQADPTRSREVAGVRGYQINHEAYYAVFDNVIALTNRPDALEKSIRLKGATTGRLSDLEPFRQARSRTAYDALAWAYVDVESLKAQLKEKWIPEKLPNGLASMIFGGIVESARQSDTASADLVVAGDGISVNLFLHTKGPLPESERAYFAPPPPASAWSTLTMPRSLGEISVRRDWYELWTQREKRVSAKGLAELSEFANNMTNLLGSLDFGDDFLSQAGDELRVLSNLQVFPDGKAPMPQLPAFGMILPLENAATFGQRLESAMTMAFSLISMQASQNNKPGLLLDIETYKGCKLICAKYPDPPADAAPLPQHYNFSPAAAVVKDRFIVGSTKQFLKDVIDAAETLPSQTQSAANRASSYLNVRMKELGDVLRANLEPLLAKKMLEEGKTRAEAQFEWDILLRAVDAAEQVVVSVDRVSDGLKATAKLELRAAPRLSETRP